jgi:glycosyltransferase involved in cell wall biosynthesis
MSPQASGNGNQLHVAYIGVHDLDYPRNRRVRSYLESEMGARVTVVSLERRSGLVRAARILLRASRTITNDVDVVVLSEFALEHILATKLLAKQKKALLVVDWFVGLHETRIEDPGNPSFGMKAAAYRLLDRAGVRLANLTITDTVVRARELTRRYKPARPVLSLPVGAPSWARPDGATQSHIGPLKVLYYGNYVPLHGVETILDAFASDSLRGQAQLTMIGDGHRRPDAESAVASHGLSESVRFLNSVPESQLLELIHAHDVVLGIFGTSSKAATVIANKVWQGLASGRTVVTRSSDALSEIATIVGPALVQVPPGDSESLAKSLRSLADEAGSHPSSTRIASALENYVAESFATFGATIRELTSAARPDATR